MISNWRLALGCLQCMTAMIPALAQTADYTYLRPARMAPPSPEVSAIFKVQENAVTLYNGLPDISVPLYEIQLKDFSHSITLQYQSGGIRVDDVASNVGIGWTLNASGALYITQHGKPDNAPQLFLDPAIIRHPTEPAPELDLSNPGDPRYLWYKEAASGIYDTEPDVYSFSAGAFGGKFFFDQNGYVHPIPLRKIKVTGQYCIVDERGNAYYFDKKETSTTGLGSENRSYYLSKIVTANRDSIQFTYEASNYSYEVYLGEVRHKFYGGFNNPEILASVGAYTGHSVFGTNTVTGWRLKEINATNGAKLKIIYSTTARTDLPNTHAITAVEIYHNSTLLKRHRLVQEYKGNTANVKGHRLRLKEVYEEAPDGSRLPSTVFSYDDSEELPPRLSAQDHWGYANGRGEGGTRLPIALGFDGGADRSVNGTASKAGMLTSIKYPTGGTTSFTFEPNSYWTSETTQSTINGGAGLGAWPYEYREHTFTVPAGTRDMRVRYNTYNEPYNPGPGPIPDPPYEEERTVWMWLKKPGNQTEMIDGRHALQIGDPINLPPGEYTICIDAFGNNSHAYWQVSWVKDTTVYFTGSKLAGGHRIKRIVMTDSVGGPSKTTIYDYAAEDSIPHRSSGIVPFRPIYEYMRSVGTYKDEGGPQWVLRETRVLLQGANPVLPISFEKGNIFYSKVTVYEGADSSNGKTVYNFTYLPPTGGDFGYPSTPRGTYDFYNGQLLTKETYRKEPSGAFRLIAMEENKYSIVSDETYWQHWYQQAAPPEAFRGLGMTVNYFVPETSGGMRVYSAKFDVGVYNLVSKWQRLDTTIQTIYADNGQVLRKETVFKYDNPTHIQPTQTITRDSKQQENMTVTTYPEDYSGNPALSAMKTRNMVAYPVEQFTYRNAALRRQAKIKYNFWHSNSLILPDTILSSYNGRPLEIELVYQQYDTRGKVLQYMANDGITTAMLWGYGNNLPVAEVKGSTYASASGMVINSVLQNPASDAALRTELNKIRTGLSSGSAQVTAYTHSPLIGVSSITDPKGLTSLFEYDAFGRLRLVRDHWNNITKQYEYKYQY